VKSRPHSFSNKKLATLQRVTFDYFLKETNPENGLVPDSTRQGSPCSIAPTGFALAAYPVGVERGFLTRRDAIRRTLTTLRFFHNSAQGKQPDATGYKGFYYHFLDMKTGRRTWDCELSTIDSTFLIAGALTAAEYFRRDNKEEQEIRELADAMYRRADWQWARNRGVTVTHGWRPETGFIKYRWHGYDEALLLYVLGLASPTHPLPAKSYRAWTRTYKWKKLYGREFLYAAPLFIHQLSHMWIDLRGIQDDYMRAKRSTISRTAAAPHTFSGNMRFAIRGASKAMVNTFGVLPRAMVRDRQAKDSKASWFNSTTTLTAAFPTAPTMEHWLPGPWSLPSLSPPRSFCRRSNISTGPIPR
jgi:hypothetical protein